MNKKKSIVTIFESVKTKIVACVLAAIVITVVIIMALSLPKTKSTVQTLTSNYIMDVTKIAGHSLQNTVDAIGYDEAMNVDTLGDIVGDVSVNGMDSSYAYVVSSNGTMLYHPTADKIGSPVENAAVKQLLAEIEKGNRPETDIITYEFKGVIKYASYYIGLDSDYILVVTLDEEEALSSVNEEVNSMVIAAIVAVIICGIIGMFVALKIAKPIINATNEIAKLAQLDFTQSDIVSNNKRRDEVGIMINSVGILQKKLADVVMHITQRSDQLYNSSVDLTDGANQTLITVEQVEKAISDIATGASSQAGETQVANESVITMGNVIEEARKEVEELRVNADIMKNAGDNASKILEELRRVNNRTKDTVQIIAEQTSTTNQSAAKIKFATDVIAEIAEETNLLSLNASIEAARAGEQGRGFAVVAAQIQQLAEQSNESARQIAQIIDVLIEESNSSVATMEDAKKVMEAQNENVEATRKAFDNVKNGIAQSLEKISIITDKTRELDVERGKVVDVVQNLTAIAEENAASTEETSASATEMSAVINMISDNAGSLTGIADGLKEEMSGFKI